MEKTNGKNFEEWFGLKPRLHSKLGQIPKSDLEKIKTAFHDLYR